MRKSHKKGKKHANVSSPASSSADSHSTPAMVQPAWQTSGSILPNNQVGTIQILDPSKILNPSQTQDIQNFQNSYENQHNQFSNADGHQWLNNTDVQANTWSTGAQMTWDRSNQVQYGESSGNFDGQYSTEHNTLNFPSETFSQSQTWNSHQYHNQQIYGTNQVTSDMYGTVPWTNVQQENREHSDYINLNANQNLPTEHNSSNQTIIPVNFNLTENVTNLPVAPFSNNAVHDLVSKLPERQSSIEYNHNSSELYSKVDNRHVIERKDSWLSNSSLRSYNTSVEPPSLDSPLIDDVSQQMLGLSLEKDSSLIDPSLESGKSSSQSSEIITLSRSNNALHISEENLPTVNSFKSEQHFENLHNCNLQSSDDNQSWRGNYEVPLISSQIQSPINMLQNSSQTEQSCNAPDGALLQIQPQLFSVYQSQSAPVSTRVSPSMAQQNVSQSVCPPTNLLQNKSSQSLINDLNTLRPTKSSNADSEIQSIPFSAEVDNKQLPQNKNKDPPLGVQNLRTDHHLDIFMNPIEPKESSAFQPLGKSSQFSETTPDNDQKIINQVQFFNSPPITFVQQTLNSFGQTESTDNSGNLETLPDNAELPHDKLLAETKTVDLVEHSENNNQIFNVDSETKLKILDSLNSIAPIEQDTSKELKKSHPSLFQKQHQRESFNNSPSATLWDNSELPPVNIFLAPAAPPSEVNQQVVNDNSHSKKHCKTNLPSHVVKKDFNKSFVNKELKPTVDSQANVGQSAIKQSFTPVFVSDNSSNTERIVKPSEGETYFKPVLPLTSSPIKEVVFPKESELSESLLFSKSRVESNFTDRLPHSSSIQGTLKSKPPDYSSKHEAPVSHRDPLNDRQALRKHRADPYLKYPSATGKMEATRPDMITDYEYRDRSRPSSANSGNEQDTSYNHDYYEKERPSSRTSDRPRSRQGQYWDRTYPDYYDYRRDDYYRRDRDSRAYGYDYDRYYRELYDRERYARYDEYYRQAYYAPQYSQYDKGYYAELNSYGSYQGQYPQEGYSQYRGYGHYDDYDERRSNHSSSSAHDSYHHDAKDKRDSFHAETDSQRSSSRQGLEHNDNYHSQDEQGSTYFDPTTHTWYIYDYSIGEWKQSAEIPSTPQRLTPAKFNNPHVIVRFGPGGQLIKVLPNLPQDGQPAIVEIHEIQTLVEDIEIEEFKAFPGPLIRGDTHKNDVLQFCLMKAKQARENIDLVDQKSCALLWELMVLLIRQNGAVVGTDISELLLRDHEMVYQGFKKITRGEKSSSDSLSNMTGSTNALNEEDITNKFREFLLFGHKKEALEWAMKNNSWGHALFLASKMDSRTYASVMTRFANSLVLNDPIQTFYQLMSGRQPAAVTCVADELWGDWSPHLAMILSNCSNKPELDRKSIIQLGDTLAARGCLHASHFCYLMADLEFGEYSKKSSKLVLIGSSHVLDFQKFASNEAIQFTEVYEYTQSLANNHFFLPHLQPYKLIYACRLAEQGLVQEALRYCEVINSSIQVAPNLFGLPFIKSVFELATKLKCHDSVYSNVTPDSFEQEELHWLQELKNLIDMFNSGVIQPQQADSALPEHYSSTGNIPPNQLEVSGYSIENQNQYEEHPSYSSIDTTSSQFLSPSTEYPQTNWNQQLNYSNAQSYGENFTSSSEQVNYRNISNENQTYDKLEDTITNSSQAGSGFYSMAPQIIEQSHRPVEDSHSSVNSSSLISKSIPPKPINSSVVKSSAKSTDKSKSKPGASSQKGWISGIFSRIMFKRQNEMKLPDDKNPKILWDAATNRWVNTEEDEDEGENGPAEPPKDSELMGSIPIPTAVPSTSANRFQKPKGLGMRQNYVDILNPGSTKISTTTPANLFPLMDTSPPQMPNFFIPSAAPSDKMGDTDFVSTSQASNISSRPDSTTSKDSPGFPDDNSSEFSRSSSMSTLSHEVHQYTQIQPSEMTSTNPPLAPDFPHMFNPAQFSASAVPSHTSKGLSRYGKQPLHR